MLKAIHAQENKGAARKKAEAVAEELRNMKLKEASKKICDSIEETLIYGFSARALAENPYQQRH